MKIPSYLYKKKYAGIYCIENTFNNKRYIGSSQCVYSRLHKHNSLLNNLKHENPYLQSSWNKHGTDMFECYIVEFCAVDMLTQCEQKWIDELKPEYNITLSVERNILSEESRKKISETLKQGYADGSILPTRTRSVDAFDLDGNFIRSFPQIRLAARELGVNHTSINRILKGMYQQVSGYQFKYSDDDKVMGKIEKSKYLRRFARPQ